MKLKDFIESLNGTKIKDPVEERLKKTLISLEIPVKGSADKGMFYINNGLATPIEDEVIYEALGVPEVNVETFYDELDLAKSESVDYEEGQILTALTNDGIKLTFVYLRELSDGTLLGVGELSRSGQILMSKTPIRYTKSRCRKANASEITAFIKSFSEYTNVLLKRIGSKVSTFLLRKNNQLYYYTTIDWKTGKVTINDTHEQGTLFDEEKFVSGNYFETKQEAIDAVKNLKV